MQVHSYSSLGILPIDTLSNYYDANVLTDFHFSEKFTTVTQTTLSTKKQMSVQLTTGLEATIGLPGAEIKNSQELTTQFTIDQMVTYMVSRTQEFQVDMLVNQAKVQGKVFALALAAEVYTIKWSTWQVDDYWWGKYEVKGSRQEEVAYLSIKPYVTIVERDKGLIF